MAITLRGLLAVLHLVLAAGAGTAREGLPRPCAEWEPALGTPIAWPLEIPDRLVQDLATEGDLFVLRPVAAAEARFRLVTTLGVPAACGADAFSAELRDGASLMPFEYHIVAASRSGRRETLPRTAPAGFYTVRRGG